MAGISFMFRNTSEDLAIKLEGSKGIFTVGCVHCDVDSQDDSGYAPSKLSDLITKDIDYWALGHIHKRMVMHERPYVVYPGNPQGRNIKESGEKGAYVVTVTSNTLTDLQFVPTHTIIWEKIEADITGCNLQTFVERVSSLIKKGSVVRLMVTGRGTLDHMLRTAPDDVIKTIEERSDCIVEKIKIDSRPESLPITGGNNLVSKIAEVSELVGNLDTNDLIEAICNTSTSKTYLQNYFEDMSDDELKGLVRDAEIRLLERFSEASE
jgi:DNA repair exonuclease SbcCD nuclease subunit